jgi:hypothetical protein
MVYVHMGGRQIQEAMMKFSPVDKIERYWMFKFKLWYFIIRIDLLLFNKVLKDEKSWRNKRDHQKP